MGVVCVKVCVCVWGGGGGGGGGERMHICTQKAKEYIRVCVYFLIISRCARKIVGLQNSQVPCIHWKQDQTQRNCSNFSLNSGLSTNRT